MTKSLWDGVLVWIRSLIVGLGATLVVASVSVAEEAGREGPRLVGASSNNFPPVNILDRDGELTGFGRELANAVVRAAGGTVTHIHSRIWTEVLDWLDSGKADFIHDTGYTPGRTSYLDYSEPILQMPEEIFVLFERFDIHSLESLYGRRVACVNEHITHLYLKKIPRIDCVIVKTPPEAVQALLDGKVDALIYPRQIVLYYAYRLNARDRIKTVGEPLRTLTWHMTVKKGNADVLLLLNRGIAKVKASGAYDRIYDKWFGQALAKGYSARDVGWIIGAILALMALFSAVIFSWVWILRRTVDARTKALRESEGRFRNFADSASDWFWEVDIEGRFTWFSIDRHPMTGNPTAELIGKRPGQTGLVDPEAAVELEALFEDSLARRVPFRGFHTRVKSAAGETFDLGISGVPFFDDHGAFKGIRGCSTDISAHVRAEEQLRQALKMEAVGHLTGGIAHDFNNILTVVFSNLQLMERLLPEDGENDRSSPRVLNDNAMRAATRGAELSHRLLAFARKQPLDPRAIGVGEVVGGMEDMIRRTVSENIDIRIERHDSAPAYADPSQLENALLNLVINARDAMPDGGSLMVETADAFIEPDDLETAEGIAPGSYVMVSVTDTGTGIPAELQSRVFEPFFTTKELGAGSGLGLSMVHGFARQSGGMVDIRSAPGEGTTVRILLPTTGPESVANDASEPGMAESSPDGEGEVILLVEDDAPVRDSTRAILEDLGYLVLTAEDGPSAIATLRRSSGIDLLLTDMVMPGGLTGTLLAKQAQMECPDLKVVFLSGHVDAADIPDFADPERVRFIRKPYTIDTLAHDSGH